MSDRAPPGAAAQPLDADELRLLDAYWRAANYLSVGQIYLLDNPLLREPLRPEHVKPRLLGHWGTTPGLNLIYAHLNRAIRARDLDAIYITGPGPRRAGAGRQRLPRGHVHRGLPARSAATRTGCASCSASSPSRAASRATSRRRRPGSIHEGGELGYALAHAFGAAFDNPDLLVALRRRRRRGRDRAAGGELALEQVPQPGARRRGAADPAPQRLQDRQPDRARAHPGATSSSRSSRATASEPLLVAGDDPDDGAPGASPRRSTTALDEIAEIQQRGARRTAAGRARAGR